MVSNPSLHGNSAFEKKENDNKGKNLRSVLWIVFSLALGLFIRTFLFAPFVIHGASMETHFHHGDHLIVNKSSYVMGPPSRGDVIMFHATQNSDYVKRVIATEGETVQMKSDRLFIHGTEINEEYLSKAIDFFHQKGLLFTNDFGPITVPKGKCLSSATTG